MRLISFFNLYELLPDFIRANNIGSLVSNLGGVKVLIPVHVFFLSRRFDFTYSAIVYCAGNQIDNVDDGFPCLNNFSDGICFHGVLCLFFCISLKKFLIVSN